MKISLLMVLGIFFVLAVQFEESSAKWWKPKTSACLGGQPYYFGTTGLWCMRKKGKRAPSRNTLAFSHRWILFRGKYYEWGSKNYSVASSPMDSDRCSTIRESRPAGYSHLSADCLTKCAQSYRMKYGRYRLFRNNCHHFANRMSAILCNNRHCPSWCK